ncbi:hypothetical protein GALMADRAFT_78835 [Galerina marginata CBS 339.88]|uniref:CHAT domain-containing protein n=1 Tax=Galerina marginata (strain CBS 339.88) TaxID=685588 RepID=A0A067SBG1_GALM3|nr:hypothetical protein GALMADRAFT_78835 [Galerina marginata CBS 339.88]
MSLENTATTTETHFDYTSRLRQLDEAVLLARESLKLHYPPDPLHSEFLDNLADAVTTRFQDGGQRGDLDEAISLYQQALELRPLPDPNRATSLTNLSKVLLIRFQQGGQQSDIDEAISLPKQALGFLPPSHPLQSFSLHNLALALYRQFEITGQKCDLDESILLHQQALKLRVPPNPLRSASLSDLANALELRGQQEGRHDDLNEAILLHRQALDLRPPDHPRRFTSLSNLASSLGRRFEHRGHRIDLEEAIFLLRQAVDSSSRSDPERFMCMCNLAAALRLQFEQEGRRSNLNEAILLVRQAALELRPFRPLFLYSLSNGLWIRFCQDGHQRDLDEAILLHRQALELLPSPHLYRSSSLDNLAIALHARVGQDGHQSDLDEAILLHRQALELRPSPHPFRSSSLNNLATALQTKFGKEGRRIDLDEAISLNREALNFRNLSHPHRSESLNNLANALRTRFVQDGHKPDCNEAILMYREALELRHSPHPDQSQSLYELGIGLLHAHSFTGNNLDEAMESFSAATQCLNQPASLRLRITLTWIKHAVAHRHMSAIDAHDAALQALTKLAALRFDIKSRQKALLTDSDGLAREASRFAIQVGKMSKAIEFIEAGRAVFWSQFLSLRSPLDQLREVSPELADKLRSTATALELGSHRSTSDTTENRRKFVIDQETARLNRLNEEWSKAIEDVRQLNGFENFLRPHRMSDLQVAALGGPVIILIGNNDGSDILILTSVDVRTIHLSDLPNEELQTLVHLIQFASSDSLRSTIDGYSGNIAEFPPAMVETSRNWMKLKEERGMRYKGQKDSDAVFIFVLDILWNKVVRPVINILHLEKSEELELPGPVVQWCPTGLFSFLPIHAAGCYNDSQAIECASDYFISSYTPTIGAMLTQYQTPPGPFRMMVVIQSRELPSTRKELEKIEQHVSEDLLVKLGIPGQSASVEAVASRLSDVAIVHFSCHGTQDRSNPLDSGLKLEDGYLRVSRIMKEKIQNGALAFLCACETAMGDDKLPDEAMSLGASLLFSGFRRVVATMWEMRDEDGPVIADTFYQELFRGPDGKPTQEPDVSKSAYALHLAVKKLRAEKVSFVRWVPFIHMGK